MKRIGGLMAFLSADAREKLVAVMKRNQIDDERKGIEYCIDMVWFGQIGQYEERGDRDE